MRTCSPWVYARPRFPPLPRSLHNSKHVTKRAVCGDNCLVACFSPARSTIHGPNRVLAECQKRPRSALASFARRPLKRTHPARSADRAGIVFPQSKIRTCELYFASADFLILGAGPCASPYILFPL